MVVVWSTMNATQDTTAMIGSALHGGPPSMEVSGTSSKFVDSGKLHHTQYIHTVTFKGLKPGSPYCKHLHLNILLECYLSYIGRTAVLDCIDSKKGFVYVSLLHLN